MQSSSSGHPKHLLRDQAQIAATTLRHVNRIVVPFDCSDCTKKALAYSVALAKHFNAALYLLTFRPCNNPKWDDYLTILIAELSVKIPVTHRTTAGNPKDEILREVLRSQPDLLVIGVGSPGFSCILDQRELEAIVAETACPVIVVHAKEKEIIEGKEMPASNGARR